jgi:hypothetical protein
MIFSVAASIVLGRPRFAFWKMFSEMLTTGAQVGADMPPHISVVCIVLGLFPYGRAVCKLRENHWRDSQLE